MTDRLIRAITADGMVKATAVTTRELTERARQIHKTLPSRRLWAVRWQLRP